jgi:hypothetical protein
MPLAKRVSLAHRGSRQNRVTAFFRAQVTGDLAPVALPSPGSYATSTNSASGHDLLRNRYVSGEVKRWTNTPTEVAAAETPALVSSETAPYLTGVPSITQRLHAWLQNYRRALVRYEYHLENYVGFVHLACLLILLRAYL